VFIQLLGKPSQAHEVKRMIKNYRQELRPTGKPGEFQMFYIEETLSAEAEAEIAQLIAERIAEENQKDPEV